MKMTSKTKSTGRLKKFIADTKRNGGLTSRARQVMQEKQVQRDDNARADQ